MNDAAEHADFRSALLRFAYLAQKFGDVDDIIEGGEAYEQHLEAGAGLGGVLELLFGGREHAHDAEDVL